MPLVPAKCTQCGAILEVDSNQEAAVCKHCGTPFIIEKAISNYNINIENANMAPSKENLLKLARRAKKDNNASEAVQYYEQILLQDPDDWEATFFSRYFRISEFTISQIIPNANSINQSIETSLQLVKDHVPNVADQAKALVEISEYTNNLLVTMYEASKQYYFGHRTEHHADMEYAQRSSAIIAALVTFGNDEYRLFKDNPDLAQICIVAKKRALEMIEEVNDNVGRGQKGMYDGMLSPLMKDCVDMIKKFDPAFVPPSIPYRPVQTQTYTTASSASVSSSNNNSGGCYVATCVYGSYNCPEVWVLRRFRDYRLKQNIFGRGFIKIYYGISPTIVRLFGNFEWFHKLWKPRLDRIVEKLKSKGMSDAPYND